MDKELLKKHELVLSAARKYYVENQPTGMTDEDYNRLEEAARQDGVDPRTIVLSSVRGERAQNADYLSQVPKEQVTGSMYTRLLEVLEEGDVLLPKYDGSSLAVYFKDGECTEIITAGGENRGGLGVVQTEKFKKWIPKVDPRIKCIQCEFLVDLKHGFGDKSRMKANGLMNSKDMQEEVDRYGTLRAFRIFGEFDPKDYWDIFFSIPMTFDDPNPKFPSLEESLLGVEFTADVKFSIGAYGFSIDKELESTYESDIYDNKCPTGGYYGTPFRQQLLIDGWVVYGADGNVKKAYKFKDAGRGELSEVLEFKWNSQILKNKDSWSCNAIITPITIRGAKITKPSCPVNRIITEGLGIGSKVKVILANETIPYIDEVVTRSSIINSPVCTCGYVMELDNKHRDGNNLICLNNNCSHRKDRVKNYLLTIRSIDELNLTKLFSISRFDFSVKLGNYHEFKSNIIEYIKSHDYQSYDSLLSSIRLSSLQRKLLDLIKLPVYEVLSDYIMNETKN